MHGVEAGCPTKRAALHITAFDPCVLALTLLFSRNTLLPEQSTSGDLDAIQVLFVPNETWRLPVRAACFPLLEVPCWQITVRLLLQVGNEHRRLVPNCASLLAALETQRTLR